MPRKAYVVRTNGKVDAWDNAMPIVMYEEGILRIERANSGTLAFYAAGMWTLAYTSDAKPD